MSTHEGSFLLQLLHVYIHTPNDAHKDPENGTICVVEVALAIFEFIHETEKDVHQNTCKDHAHGWVDE